MNEKEIENIIQMNQRLCLLLGYASSMLHKISIESMSIYDKEKYQWLMKSIENVIYLDKPLPPSP